jgi:N-acetylmuramic acid 6-phosphate etherase
MQTEARNPATEHIDRLPVPDILRLMNEEDAKVAAAVAEEIPHIAAAVEAIVGRLRAGGRLFYLGAGTSGRLGVVDASECPPTFGTDPSLVTALIAGGREAVFQAQEGAEDDEEAAFRDLDEAGFGPGDALVGIAASGRTPYVLAGLRHAKALGAAAIALTCNPDCAAAEIADIMIAPAVGPEALAGSTRLKAGTAQKLALNMLSTATMIKLGRTRGNLLSHMRITNEKLRGRAVGIICEVTGTSETEAARALEEAGGVIEEAVRQIADSRGQITDERLRRRRLCGDVDCAGV